MLSLAELKREWMVIGRGHLLYGSRREVLPFELWVKGYDLLVAWHDAYPKSIEFDWVLVRGGEIIKQWDYSPSLSDLFDVLTKEGQRRKVRCA